MRLIGYLCLALALGAGMPGQGEVCAERKSAQVTFRVLTDEGVPVSNVSVTARIYVGWRPGEGFGEDIYEEHSAISGAKGLATVKFETKKGEFRYGIYNEPGYYPTRNLIYRFKGDDAERWVPWDPIVDVVCKPIVDPIQMYARKVGGPTRPKEIPAQGKPVGYDLVAGEWVAPYGNGTVSDLVFNLSEVVAISDPSEAFEYHFSISFSNLGDGIQSVLAPRFEGSELRLPRFAPEDGYVANLVKRIGRPEVGQPLFADSRVDQNYFFRVRTVLDEDGGILEAYYGKILGDIECDVINSPKGYVGFSYCLNPNSLDRNMEFDPQKNLFDELPFLLRVREP